MKHRLIALLLAVLMLTGVFTACNTDTPDPDPIPPQSTTPDTPSTPQDDADQPVESVYQASFSSLDDELMKNYSVESITSFCVSGKTAFLTAQCIDPDASSEPYYDPVTDEMFEGESVYRTVFFSVNLDTMAVQPLQYQPSQLKEGREGVYLLSDVCPGENDTVWIIETIESYYYDLPEDFDPESDSMWNYYMADDPAITLMHFDANGSLLNSSNVFYPSGAGEIYSLTADVSGNVYVSTANTLYLYNSTGALKSELDINDGILQNFGAKGIGHVAYVGGTQEIRMIDAETGSLQDSIYIENSAWAIGQGSANYDLTYIQNGVIFGMNADEGESAPVLDWLTCDINASDILQYSILEDDSILALAKEDDQYGLVHVKLVDKATVPVRQELVLATAFLSSDLRTAIVNFNRSQDSLRIRVKDYSLSNMEIDGLHGADALVRDISAGNVPDLLFTDALPVHYLAKQGILLDLKPLIDADSQLSGDALMTNVFDAAEIDGKLFEISSRFTLSTAATSVENAPGSQWTYDAAMDALNAMADGATVLSTSAALKQMISVYLYEAADAFVDWDTMTCNFDNEKFVETLQFINDLNEDISQISGKKETEYRKIYSNKQLFSVHNIDDLFDVAYANALHRDNASLVGYPTVDGSKSYFHLENPIAITSACTDSAAAWEFVRTFLTDSYQNIEQGIGLPTNKAAFDAYAAKMMTIEYTTDSEGNQIEVSRGTVKLDDIISIQLYAVSEQEFMLFNELYENCSHMNRNNQTLFDMINAEVSAMLNGQTAEDTAAAIQTAVEAYLNQLK